MHNLKVYTHIMNKETINNDLQKYHYDFHSFYDDQAFDTVMISDDDK